MSPENAIHFYLFRHGETDWNLQNRFHGHTDTPLNARGRQQALELPSLVGSLGLTHLVSSDLSRARETARVLADHLKLPLKLDARFREAHLGAAQGLTAPEIVDRFGQPLLEAWRSHNPDALSTRYPGGESGQEILLRVMDGLRELSQLPGGSQIGICTHGGVIRRMLQLLHPEPSAHHPIPNTAIYVFHSSHLSPDNAWHLHYSERLR